MIIKYYLKVLKYMNSSLTHKMFYYVLKSFIKLLEDYRQVDLLVAPTGIIVL